MKKKILVLMMVCAILVSASMVAMAVSGGVEDFSVGGNDAAREVKETKEDVIYINAVEFSDDELDKVVEELSAENKTFIVQYDDGMEVRYSPVQ